MVSIVFSNLSFFANDLIFIIIQWFLFCFQIINQLTFSEIKPFLMVWIFSRLVNDFCSVFQIIDQLTCSIVASAVPHD